MSRECLFPFVLMVVWTLGGCQSSEPTDRVSQLQEQIGRIAQQLNETKAQVDGLQEANQRSARTMEDLAATVERLNAASLPPMGGKGPKGGAVATGGKSQEEARPQGSLQLQGKARDVLFTGVNPVGPSATGEKHTVLLQEDEILRSDEGQATTDKEAGTTMVVTSCSQVWKQLGQGQNPAAAARALGISVAAIEACEQKIGRGSASR